MKRLLVGVAFLVAFLTLALADRASAAPKVVRVVVKTRAPIGDASLQRLRKSGAIYQTMPRLRLVDMEVPEAAIAHLRALPDVEYVEPDRPIFPISLPPDFSQGSGSWSLDLVNVANPRDPSATRPQFDATRVVDETGDGVYVAIVDTGLMAGWTDKDTGKTYNWWEFLPPERIDQERSRSFIKGEGHKDWQQRKGHFHGTIVTGVVLGMRAANPALPPPFPLDIDGVAPRANIIVLKALPADSQGSIMGAVEALYYCADLAEELWPARLVVNNSWGMIEPSPSVLAAVNDAIDHGAIVVGGAGNCGPYLPQDSCGDYRGMLYPGAFPRVITAGAAGWTGNFTIGGVPSLDPFWQAEDVAEGDPAAAYLASFSSRADPTIVDPEGGHQQIDLVAPGNYTLGTPLADYTWGSSFATPHVTAAAALLLEKNPRLTQAEIEQVLIATALPLAPGSGYLDTSYDRKTDIQSLVQNPTPWTTEEAGAGMLQCDAALRAISP